MGAERSLEERCGRPADDPTYAIGDHHGFGQADPGGLHPRIVRREGPAGTRHGAAALAYGVRHKWNCIIALAPDGAVSLLSPSSRMAASTCPS